MCNWLTTLKKQQVQEFFFCSFWYNCFNSANVIFIRQLFKCRIFSPLISGHADSQQILSTRCDVGLWLLKMFWVFFFPGKPINAVCVHKLSRHVFLGQFVSGSSQFASIRAGCKTEDLLLPPSYLSVEMVLPV